MILILLLFRYLSFSFCSFFYIQEHFCGCKLLVIFLRTSMDKQQDVTFKHFSFVSGLFLYTLHRQFYCMPLPFLRCSTWTGLHYVLLSIYNIAYITPLFFSSSIVTFLVRYFVHLLFFSTYQFLLLPSIPYYYLLFYTITTYIQLISLYTIIFVVVAVLPLLFVTILFFYLTPALPFTISITALYTCSFVHSTCCDFCTWLFVVHVQLQTLSSS